MGGGVLRPLSIFPFCTSLNSIISVVTFSAFGSYGLRPLTPRINPIQHRSRSLPPFREGFSRNLGSDDAHSHRRGNFRRASTKVLGAWPATRTGRSDGEQGEGTGCRAAPAASQSENIWPNASDRCIQSDKCGIEDTAGPGKGVPPVERPAERRPAREWRRRETLLERRSCCRLYSLER